MANDITAYKFKVALSFKLDSKSDAYKIDPNFIRYIVIENLYTSRMMPVIYVSMVINNELYDKIHESQNASSESNTNNGKFVLQINRYNRLAKAALFETSIKGEFDFILSDESPNYSKQLEIADVSGASNYRTVTVALLSVSLLNAVRAEKDKNNSILVSGIFSNIDMNTLIAKVFEGVDKYGIKTIIKPPIHNTEFKKNSLVIPPMNSRKKIINYLFNKAPFYDTDFTFFLDFSRGYLIDRTSEGLKVKDNTYHDVIFEIHDAVSDYSYIEGIKIKNKSYTIYINPSKAQIKPNRGQDKIANTYISVSDNGTIDAVNIDNNSSIDSDPKYIFSRGSNARLYKNNKDSNSVVISVSKENLDGAIFTPNKRYRVKNYGDYTKYDGFYYLDSKREVIFNNSGDFTGSTEFVLRKIGNISDIGDTDDEGEVFYRDGSKTANNLSEALKDANTESGMSSSSRHSQTTNVNESNTTKTDSESQLVSVNNTDSIYSSGSQLGSDSIEKYKNGTLKGEPLMTNPVALGASPTLTIEEQLKLAEENRTPRKHGNEVDYSSSGPVKTFKYNENKIITKFIES